YTPDNPAIERYFKSIAAHNTVEIDGRDPLYLVSRFLWLPWIRARLRGFVGQGEYLWIEGEHYAYTRLPGRVVHRRTIVSLSGERWAIVDDVLGRGEHRLTLRWHLADFPVRQEGSRVTLETPQGPCTLAVAGRTPQA